MLQFIAVSSLSVDWQELNGKPASQLAYIWESG